MKILKFILLHQVKNSKNLQNLMKSLKNLKFQVNLIKKMAEMLQNQMKVIMIGI